MTNTIDTPTLIVGAGPVGLTAALLLAGQGHRCTVIERRSRTQAQPAAHVINARTLEIFRQAGLDMEAIASIAKDPEDAGHVNFLTTLTGRLIGRLPFEQQGPECLRYTPTPLRNISQHRLEPLLAEAATKHPLIELLYNTTWNSLEQHPDGVRSTATDGNGTDLSIASRFVLGADGAGSRVRKALGLNMVGPANLQSYIAVHFGANLRSTLGDRTGVLHFVLDPAARGTFVAHDIDSEWVFMIAYDESNESVDDYGPARGAELVAAAIGDSSVPIDVLGVGSWNMSAQVCEHLRDDRVFLIGDSAHRFPPTGGMGLNTGVADAHDLVWRLVGVFDGWADESILDAYEVERMPVAVQNCRQSTENAVKMVRLGEALGLTEDPSTERMLESLDDPEAQPRIAAAVEEQRTHFDMLGLQLGYVYANGTLVRDGATPEPIDDPRPFEPAAQVGARLPHAWCADGRSTLDVVDYAAFTVISFGEHGEWAACIAATSPPIPPVTHVRVGVDIDVDDSWRRECDLPTDGALLVRPDQHIAWRSHTGNEPSNHELAKAISAMTSTSSNI